MSENNTGEPGNVGQGMDGENRRDMAGDAHEEVTKVTAGEDIGGETLGQDNNEVNEASRSHVDAARNLELILDIPLEVSVELGRRRMPIHELLKLGQGSVVELGKLAGEPLDILVNQKLIARGEAVVVNEKFGVRLTDIVSQTERIERLTDDKEDGEWHP